MVQTWFQFGEHEGPSAYAEAWVFGKARLRAECHFLSPPPSVRLSSPGVPPHMKRLFLPPVCHRSSASARTYDTLGDSDRLSVVYLHAETQGPAFQGEAIHWLPVWEALVLCLIARLARQIKQPILLIGDLILYVTFL